MNQIEFDNLIKQWCLNPANLQQQSIESILILIHSTAIRDLSLVSTENEDYNFYNAVWGALVAILDEGIVHSDMEKNLLEIWQYIVTLPEFDHCRASTQKFLTFHLIEKVCQRLCVLCWTSTNDVQNVEEKKSAYKIFIHWTYLNCIDSRKAMRLLIGRALLLRGTWSELTATAPKISERNGIDSEDGGNSRGHVKPLLEILLSILEGFDTSNPKIYELDHSILTRILIPLHSPNEMVEWRDQVPVINLYHDTLIRCVLKVIDSRRHSIDQAATIVARLPLTVVAVKAILSLWPESYHTNTPKQVLFLHEIEKLLETMSGAAEFIAVIQPLLNRMVSCIGKESDNIRPAQRALTMFKNEHIVGSLFCLKHAPPDCVIVKELIEKNNNHEAVIAVKVLSTFIPALYRAGTLSWNPTVNKMTALALLKLQEQNEPLFVSYCNLLLSKPPPDRPSHSFGIESTGSQAVKEVAGRATASDRTKLLLSVKPDRKFNDVPTGRKASSMMLPPMAAMKKSSSPVTLAPWSQENQVVKDVGGSLEVTASLATGHRAIHQYILQCIPDETDRMKLGLTTKLGDSIGKGAERIWTSESDWSLAQAAPSPTLLPSMKFHDLVFGKVLGEGSFSTVKYARHINRDTTRSKWAEFAVKIISDQKIIEHDYLAAVQREYSILQLVSHPGIARLVSSFFYKECVYFVMEYASHGDLHSFLIHHGKLDHFEMRFVLGEISSVVAYLHDVGFSFNDLKPENILITELGHIKLTDFGACRPYTYAAESVLQLKSSKMEDMRDGDWKDRSSSTSFNSHGEMQNSKAQEDARVEGTPAYLPPEALTKKMTSNPMNDAWALGCVAFFCSNGFPKYFGDENDVKQQMEATDFGRNVHFGPSDTPRAVEIKQGNEKEDFDFYQQMALDDFIDSCLAFNPNKRNSVAKNVSHDYLTHGYLIDCCGEKLSQRFALVAKDLRSKLSAEAYDDTNPPVLKMNPSKLYFSQPKINIVNKVKSASTNVDLSGNMWSCRQYSVLWAPMPEEEPTNLETAKANRIAFPSNLWLSSHRYQVTIIPETTIEQNSLFMI